MNDAQHAAYSAYVRTLADLLELRDWRFDVKVERCPSSETAWACAKIRAQHRHADIWIAPEGIEQGAESARVTIAHELLHCHLHPCFSHLDNLQATIGNALYNATYNAMTDDVERAVEAMAHAIAPLLPLPPELGATE